MYLNFRTQGQLNEEELAQIETGKQVLDAAQLIANNIRGMRKVRVAYF